MYNLDTTKRSCINFKLHILIVIRIFFEIQIETIKTEYVMLC